MVVLAGMKMRKVFCLQTLYGCSIWHENEERVLSADSVWFYLAWTSGNMFRMQTRDGCSTCRENVESVLCADSVSGARDSEQAPGTRESEQASLTWSSQWCHCNVVPQPLCEESAVWSLPLKQQTHHMFIIKSGFYHWNSKHITCLSLSLVFITETANTSHVYH